MWNPFFQEPIIDPKKKKNAADIVEEWTPPTPTEESLKNVSSTTTKNGKGPCGVCGVMSKSRCGGCDRVFYCSKKHQTTDWGKHKGLCRPFSIPTQHPRQSANNNKSGSGSKASSSTPGDGGPKQNGVKWMTATREIPGGSTLLVEKPYLITPNPNVSGATTLVCLSCCRVGVIEKLALSPCTRCLLPICPHCIQTGHCGGGGVGGDEECAAVAAAVAKNRGLMLERTFHPDRYPELCRDISILKLLLLSRATDNTSWTSFLGLRTNPRYTTQVKDPTDGVKIWLDTEYSLADLYFRTNVLNKGGGGAGPSAGLKLEEVVRLWAIFSDVPPHNEGLRVIYLLRSWIGHSCCPTGELLFHRDDPTLGIYLKSVESLKDEGLISVNFMDPAYPEGISKSAIRLWDTARLYCVDKACHCKYPGRVDASVGVRCGQIKTGNNAKAGGDSNCPGYLAPQLEPPNPDKPHLGLLIYNKSKVWWCSRCRRTEKFGDIMHPLRELIDKMKGLVEDFAGSPSPTKYPGLVAQLHGHLCDQHWLWGKVNKVVLSSSLHHSLGGEGKEMLARFVRLPSSEIRTQFLRLLSLKGEIYGDGLFPNLPKAFQSQTTAKGVLALLAARHGRYSKLRGPPLLDALFTNLILFGEEWKCKLTTLMGGPSGQLQQLQILPLQTLASESVAKWRILLKLSQEACSALRDPSLSSAEGRRQIETAAEVSSILQAAVTQGAPCTALGRGPDTGGKVDWVLEVMSRFMARLYPTDTHFCSRILPRLTESPQNNRPDLLQRLFDPGASPSGGNLTFGPAYGTGASGSGSGGSGDGVPMLTLPELPKWPDLDNLSDLEDGEDTSGSSLDLDDLDDLLQGEGGDGDLFSAPLEYYQQLLDSTLRQRRATEELLAHLLR